MKIDGYKIFPKLPSRKLVRQLIQRRLLESEGVKHTGQTLTDAVQDEMDRLKNKRDQIRSCKQAGFKSVELSTCEDERVRLYCKMIAKTYTIEDAKEVIYLPDCRCGWLCGDE